jgi:hypothetical protein
LMVVAFMRIEYQPGCCTARSMRGRVPLAQRSPAQP